MKRKKWLSVLMIAVMSAGLAACGQSGASEEQAARTETSAQETESASSEEGAGGTVRIQVSKDTVCGVAMQVAAEKGYFEEELAAIGQTCDITVAASSETIDLITSGKVDAAFGLACNFITPIANGLPVSFVTGVHTGCTKFYVKADSGIADLNGLKGKTVGVPGLNDSSTLNLKRKLADLGFVVNGPDADVEFVAYAMPDLPLALENGGVDAIGLHEPVASIAEKSYDFVKVLDTGEDEKFVDEYCCMALVTQDMIDNNPEGAAAFARAVQKGAAFAQANPEEAARIQIDGGYVSGTVEDNSQIIHCLNFNPSVSAARTTFSNAFSDLQKTGDISADLDEAEFTARVFPVLEGVPETTVYDAETDTFTAE